MHDALSVRRTSRRAASSTSPCWENVYSLTNNSVLTENKLLTFSGLLIQLLFKCVCPCLVRWCSCQHCTSQKPGHLWLSSCYWLAPEKMPNSTVRTTVGPLWEAGVNAVLTFVDGRFLSSSSRVIFFTISFQTIKYCR